MSRAVHSTSSSSTSPHGPDAGAAASSHGVPPLLRPGASLPPALRARPPAARGQRCNCVVMLCSVMRRLNLKSVFVLVIKNNIDLWSLMFCLTRSWLNLWFCLRWRRVFLWLQYLQCCTQKTTSTCCRWESFRTSPAHFTTCIDVLKLLEYSVLCVCCGRSKP